MKRMLWVFSLGFFPILSQADYHVSAYISVKYLGGTAYLITVADYTIGDPQNSTFCSTVPDADTIRLWFGDGESGLVTRSNGTGDSVCECRKLNIYTAIHTYTGFGTYHIWYDVLSRNNGLSNINKPNADMLMFHAIIINPEAPNGFTSPTITNPPTCTYGCPANPYTFNLGLSTPPADSLSYALGACLTSDTASYYIPSGATIDPHTGTLTWPSPMDGVWSFSIRITGYDTITEIVSGYTLHLAIPVDTQEVELQVEITGNCSLGVGGITKENKYIVFPNPSNGVFAIQPAEPTQPWLVEIYNLLGQRVYSHFNSQDQIHTIDISNQPNGIYLYRIISDTGILVGEGKLIIQK